MSKALEKLICRGHSIEALKRDYTIAQVLLMQRAAYWNIQQEKIEQAEAISLGIAEAFNPKAELLKKYREALDKSIGSSSSRNTSKPDKRPLQPWLQGMPVVKARKRDG